MRGNKNTHGTHQSIYRGILPLFMFIVVVCAACAPPLPTPVVILPTLAVLPTETNTPRPSQTYTPSRTSLFTWTFTPSATFTPSSTMTQSLTPSRTLIVTATPTITPSLTPTITPSITLTPTFTLTPSQTLRPTLTPSNTRTFTPPPTFTPFPTVTPFPTATAFLTATPIPTPTIAGPQIIAFASSALSALPNTAVILTYQSNADSARIEVATPQNAIIQTFPVPIGGQFSVVLPGNYGRAIVLRLVVNRAGQETAQSISVAITCPTPWFFGDQYAPPGSACAAGSATTADGAYQGFERGYMLYVTANSQNRVYGLVNEGMRYISYANGWDGTTINAAPAPEGLQIPDRVFNWAYYNTNAPFGIWSASLGWANTAYAANPIQIQFEAAPATGSAAFYIDTPVGAVFRFSGGDAGTWTRIR